MVSYHIARVMILFALVRILSILVEIKRLAYCMRYVLSCLRVIRNTVVGMSAWRNSQVWATRCLNL